MIRQLATCAILASFLLPTESLPADAMPNCVNTNSSEAGNRCNYQGPRQCDLSCTVDVTIKVRNQLTSDNLFDHEVTVNNQQQGHLVHFLEKAADMDAGFKFSATFFKGMGYFIDSINGVSGNVSEKTYWHISSLPSGNSLKCGVSSYLPEHQETLLFNFTTWDSNSL